MLLFPLKMDYTDNRCIDLFKTSTSVHIEWMYLIKNIIDDICSPINKRFYRSLSRSSLILDRPIHIFRILNGHFGSYLRYGDV